ncbi:YxeA family protein [Pediococcus claussenii]|uniref:Conserved hypothetical family protein n=1 Tax=Pediococcus claussenii (strain ATCC BAA-344 / DSM 14800 / JCM 18046 / KCTC 3811 / LMG 21948 / P06) TaxID=701521 RepID=G8PCF0_PEDCP|nr:YxeA family protein [Pediococcus claussenii]AEV94935.1 conserved hypothetical family protein [Pediococcus claussenii ATCC BAA-344]ANZ70127.1 hypothetical protein AYR57_07260 [Pediococcus claussenii]ANZ71942.1 hypothetical protein AYR58_07260 [Pediococcus claussenii]KRN19262.1 hypothetical protein IV79_GL001634 [Pediococcus claussenii]
MKRSAALIVVLVVVFFGIFGGAYYWYQSNYGGTDYYTKIVNDGKKVVEKDDNGNQTVFYKYEQNGYSQDGTAKKLTFTESLGRPFKRNAYLKVVYNVKRNQVISYEKVNAGDVPDKATEKLK